VRRSGLAFTICTSHSVSMALSGETLVGLSAVLLRRRTDVSHRASRRPYMAFLCSLLRPMGIVQYARQRGDNNIVIAQAVVSFPLCPGEARARQSNVLREAGDIPRGAPFRQR